METSSSLTWEKMMKTKDLNNKVSQKSTTNEKKTQKIEESVHDHHVAIAATGKWHYFQIILQ